MLKFILNNVAGLRPATLLKRDSNISVFLRTILRTPILNNICERLLLQVSSWNFGRTQTFMNKNNSYIFKCIFLNVKKQQFCDFGNTRFLLSVSM